ncbi:MAG: epoxyqueuosine reductase [Syntrophales bacterium]|jgi:epoxyqueuosine reductase QueG|nr:epoxyqueuosine reductase [Syntrophales bacterium]MCK9390109.1 epoxyqueuosine reductase [Syntrophales bacterium]
MPASSLFIISAISKFLSSSHNSLQSISGEKAWDEALIGFSHGNDPLYTQLKADIGSFYWTPLEIFSLSFPEIPIQPDDLTVISWVLPQSAATREDQRRQKKYPAERWSRSRNFGEETNLDLARHLADILAQEGHPAVVPVLSSAWGWQTSERYGFASSWSERHTAYISGLGTFGLCDGLITEKGKAMRCGSLVAKIAIPPTPRKYRHHHDYCLFYVNGKCRKCISRCPAGAITEKGHNKDVCRKYLFEIAAEYSKSHFGFSSYGCGFCQTAVPCEAGIPKGL